jgi:hypothetical protein
MCNRKRNAGLLDTNRKVGLEENKEKSRVCLGLVARMQVRITTQS